MIHSFIKAKLVDMKGTFEETILQSIKVQLQNENSYVFSVEKEIQERLASFSKEFDSIPVENHTVYTGDTDF